MNDEPGQVEQAVNYVYAHIQRQWARPVHAL
jgi:hypothetical protein